MARTSRRGYRSAGGVVSHLLLPFFILSTGVAAVTQSHQQQPFLLPPHAAPFPLEKQLDFRLTHIFHHGTHRHPNLHKRRAVPADIPLWIQEEEDEHKLPAPKLRARSLPMNIQRLSDRAPARMNALLDAGRESGQPVSLPASAWTVDNIAGPNITDKETVISFARMAANAYILEPHTGDWYDVGGGFNYSQDFGWEQDGLRGHIFADTKNKTVVIGLKGTSPAVFDGSGSTTEDKVNDNLFFSCCCGQGGSYLWKQVCDCQSSTFKCNSTCLVTALKRKNRYYYAGQDLYHNVTALYPDADIWLAGHSLGGAVASLLGLTYGHPAVTFEAVPEAMPAARLGLPTPPGYHIGSDEGRATTGAFHFGHTADPIYMGSCNGASSVCSIGGYAMESVCHTGMECVYHTVEDKGWRLTMLNHKMRVMLHDVIEAYNETAKCEPVTDCTDCFNWKYFKSNGSDTTTTSTTTMTTSSYTQTRTQTCQTPGWWGCLDEPTSTRSTTTTTKTTSTSTCKTPGWFGCRDRTTTTTTTTSSSTRASITPGPSLTMTSTTTTSTCRHPGFFWGCRDHAKATPGAVGVARPTARVLNDYEQMQWGQLGL